MAMEKILCVYCGDFFESIPKRAVNYLGRQTRWDYSKNHKKRMEVVNPAWGVTFAIVVSFN
jgi:hypothetical protein